LSKFANAIAFLVGGYQYNCDIGSAWRAFDQLTNLLTDHPLKYIV